MSGPDDRGYRMRDPHLIADGITAVMLCRAAFAPGLTDDQRSRYLSMLNTYLTGHERKDDLLIALVLLASDPPKGLITSDRSSDAQWWRLAIELREGMDLRP